MVGHRWWWWWSRPLIQARIIAQQQQQKPPLPAKIPRGHRCHRWPLKIVRTRFRPSRIFGSHHQATIGSQGKGLLHRQRTTSPATPNFSTASGSDSPPPWAPRKGDWKRARGELHLGRALERSSGPVALQKSHHQPSTAHHPQSTQNAPQRHLHWVPWSSAMASKICPMPDTGNPKQKPRQKLPQVSELWDTHARGPNPARTANQRATASQPRPNPPQPPCPLAVPVSPLQPRQSYNCPPTGFSDTRHQPRQP